MPHGPDDGTLSPWAVMASLPFAPELVIPTVEGMDKDLPAVKGKYGFACSFNPTFRTPRSVAAGWVSPAHYAINQGPVVLMIENYRSGLVWRLMRECTHVSGGLRRAGFRGGWLDTRSHESRD